VIYGFGALALMISFLVIIWLMPQRRGR